MIHFRCISIINHWYMTVIYLRRTTKKTAVVNSSPGVSVNVSRIQTMQPIATNCEVEGDFFDYGTIPSTDAAINAADSLTGNVSTIWVMELKMLARYSRFQKVFVKFIHHLHQLIDCSARLDRGKCHAAPSEWLDVWETFATESKPQFVLELKVFWFYTDITVCVST